MDINKHIIDQSIKQTLVDETKTSIDQISHINFSAIYKYWEDNKNKIFTNAIRAIATALSDFFPKGIDEIDPRRLAATFRRGDLIMKLENENNLD